VLVEVASLDPGDVKKTLVVGAGVMGFSISLTLARVGIEVALADVDDQVLSHALQLIEASLEVLTESGKVDRDDVEAILDRIHTSTDLEAASEGADFVIEAVPEVPEIKKEIFTRLSELCPGDVVIASNTSGLDIFDFAEVSNPGRLVIAHWFNPPHIIPLVEVVPGPLTAPEAVEFTASFMERLGKVPVVMKGFTRAFIVNKIQNFISMAVFDLLGSGLATPEDIDKAVKSSIGIRMPVIGVVQSMDFTGLDLALDVIKSYGLSVPFIEKKVNEGRLGVKTAKGIYEYGGRGELEILAKRDRLFLELLDRLDEMGTFNPV
jgi:3-hydroxyacyl-CoA dehydrogenase